MVAYNFPLALVGEELEIINDVHIEVEEGIITHIGKGKDPKGINMPNLIAIPSLVNSHTHASDFCFPDYGVELPISLSVSPKGGLKYNLLKHVSIYECILKFMHYSTRFGVQIVIDFYEGDLNDVEKIENENYIPLISIHSPLIGTNEISNVKGVAISSINSMTIEDMEKIKRELRGKIKAIHVSENFKHAVKGDFNLILKALDPTFIVHGVFLGYEEMSIIKERGIGLVFCPSSNLWFGLGIPPIYEAIEFGINFSLGTDNGMINTPNLWREGVITYELLRLRSLRRFGREILKAMTINGYKLINIRGGISEGNEAKIVIIDGEESGILRALDIHTAIVKRGGESVYGLLNNKFGVKQ